ncbi:phosphotransferase family protein [Salipiger sp.]|uniref:phosphotransferase family protein n=1 Tax=Salipiger sp. TaxID=2078585 RepID=UPI003A984591
MSAPSGVLDKAGARRIAREVLARERPGAPFGLGCLKNREDPMASQVFCADRPGTRLTVKLWAPALADKAAAQAARHRAVAARLMGAQEVLFFDPEARCLGLSYADGPTLSELWPVLAPAARLDRLHEAGRWLAEFHHLSRRDQPFRPAGQIAWLNRLEAWFDAGERHIPDIAAFRAEVRAMEALAAEVRRRPAQRAITHRDLHLDNLVLTPAGLCGLDFENPKEDEPYRDLVWLLIHAVSLADDATPLSDFAAALARGYGDGVTEPPLRLFLQRLFALGVWAATPEAPSLRQSARYAAAREIVAAPEPLLV